MVVAASGAGRGGTLPGGTGEAYRRSDGRLRDTDPRPRGSIPAVADASPSVGPLPAPSLTVGLTGGIGSGKSTVAGLLAACGALIVDADAIARDVTAPGSPVLAQLAERFGADVLGPDGALDRAVLAERAFVDEAHRKDLEAITHPAIGEEYLRRLAAVPPGSIVVHDVPLLVEAGREAGYAAVIVVEAPLAVRLDRLELRGVPRADAERRIALQATDEQRRAVATWIVDNSDGPAALEPQIDRIWAELRDRLAVETARAAETAGDSSEAGTAPES